MDVSVCVCLKLARFVEEERKKHIVYPPAEDVFAWTRMTDIKDVSAVHYQKLIFSAICFSDLMFLCQEAHAAYTVYKPAAAVSKDSLLE